MHGSATARIAFEWICFKLEEHFGDHRVPTKTCQVKRGAQKSISCINLRAFVKQVLNHLSLSLFSSIMKPALALSRISWIQNLLCRNILGPEELDNSVDVPSFTKIKESPYLALTLSRNAGLRVPLKIKFALTESSDNFKLVSGDPVFLCVLFEIKREVRLHHSAGKLLRTQTAESFFHELVYDVFVCVVCSYYIVPAVRIAWWFLFTTGGSFFFSGDRLSFVFRSCELASTFDDEIYCLRFCSGFLKFGSGHIFGWFLLRWIVKTIVFVVRHSLNSN